MENLPEMSGKPLDGVRVVDFTNLLPGPFCTLELARRGARVIKVERMGTGDPLRALPPRRGSQNAFFEYLNQGKESIQLDLKIPAGGDVARRLLETADVAVESFRPGAMARLGLGPGQALELNPRLVYASLSAFGADNPQPGHDLNFISKAGLLGLFEDSGLQAPPLQLGDLLGGKDAAAAIVLALFRRERTGKGGFVDLSMTDSVFDLVLPTVVEFLATRPSGDRFGRRRALTGLYPCYNVYPTRDGKWVALGALEAQFWAAFCHHVGRPAWAVRQFDSSDAFREQVAEIFRSRDFSEWEKTSRNTHFCLTPVYGMEDLADSDHVKARLPRSGTAGPPGEKLGPAPRPGQHSAAILAELGFSGETAREMFEQGAVAGPEHPARREE